MYVYGRIRHGFFCKWLYSKGARRIYERTRDGTWCLWVPTNTTSDRYITRSKVNNFQKTEVHADSIPEDSVIISVKQQESKIMIETKKEAGEETDRGRTSSLSYTKTIYSNAITQSFFCYNISLHNGHIISDGSYGNGKATYAFVAQYQKFLGRFKDLDFSKLLYCTGQVRGSLNDINAYRAELTGILAAINHTNELCARYDITVGTCTVYCDNKGALGAAFGHKRPTPRWSSYDLI